MRRLFVLIIGLTVLLVGFALVFLPGPAFVIIPLALAILATEFIWAKRLLKRINHNAARGLSIFRKSKK